MCRHLAYLGPTVTLRQLIVEPPHGLCRQAWAPRQQRYGTVNADGFGVGWYVDGDPAPARYRRAVPMWADPSFADVARVSRSGAVLAAVRSATVGTEAGEAAAAPYTDGVRLFSHNGALAGWPGGLGALAATLDPAALLDLEARCDSALLWALVQARLAAGDEPDQALAAVAVAASQHSAGRYNMLMTDGRSIAATAFGDTLCYRRGPGWLLVASEPSDDEADWVAVPDRSVLTGTAESVQIRPIDALTDALTDAAWADQGSRRARQRKEHPVTALSVDRRLPPDFVDRELRADVRRGLAATPKWLPPKWFYDDRGSELFERITRLAEYYPTRTERSILVERAAEIAAASQAETLVELGSGSAEKTRLLLDALRASGSLRRYVPVDVSEGALLGAGVAVTAEYPGLAVSAVLADFTHHLGLPPDGGRRLVAFLGGTLGNLVAQERAGFLAALRSGLADGDSLLLGVDLVKDPAELVPAYDDAAGVTAEFNRNVLAVLNRELDADFDLASFEHVARWDAEREWVEMALRSRTAQTVKVAALGMAVTFEAGEELRTEISDKFRRDGLAAELAEAGFGLRSWWTDPAGRFALCLAVPD